MTKSLKILTCKLKELELSIKLGPKLSPAQLKRIQLGIMHLVNQIDTNLNKSKSNHKNTSNVKTILS
ncbi:MAG: hypothetical protein WCK98_01200 [bacterium]